MFFYMEWRERGGVAASKIFYLLPGKKRGGKGKKEENVRKERKKKNRADSPLGGKKGRAPMQGKGGEKKKRPAFLQPLEGGEREMRFRHESLGREGIQKVLLPKGRKGKGKRRKKPFLLSKGKKRKGVTLPPSSNRGEEGKKKGKKPPGERGEEKFSSTFLRRGEGEGGKG